MKVQQLNVESWKKQINLLIFKNCIVKLDWFEIFLDIFFIYKIFIYRKERILCAKNPVQKNVKDK